VFTLVLIDQTSFWLFASSYHHFVQNKFYFSLTIYLFYYIDVNGNVYFNK